MPSNRKRIGFLPRIEVEEIITRISLTKNLSKSKVVGSLVEEALISRGFFEPDILNEFKQMADSNLLRDPLMKDDILISDSKEELVSDSGFTTESKNINSNFSYLRQQIKEEDLAILAKIKSLKALGLI
tara:strand:- start:198 stop:584 length:387 start_codon:yes stop_codon:yes gene_type:complete